MSTPFLDSNIVLYLLSAETEKADRADTLLSAGGIISVQVLNEVVSVCLRKLRLDWTEIDDILLALKATCRIVPLSVESHETAVRIARRYRIAFYDAHICAAALLAECDTLLSEDLQDGMVIDGLRVKNPFLPA